MTALLAATALGGCSDDDEPTDDSSTSSPAPEAGEAPKSFERPCDVTVQATGAVEVSWEGEGSVSDAAGPTIYTFADGEDSINVYAESEDVTTNANLTVGGATYTTTSADGIDAASNGTSAEVDVDTEGVDGAGPHVTATFTCGKGGKGGKG